MKPIETEHVHLITQSVDVDKNLNSMSNISHASTSTISFNKQNNVDSLLNNKTHFNEIIKNQNFKNIADFLDNESFSSFDDTQIHQNYKREHNTNDSKINNNNN